MEPPGGGFCCFEINNNLRSESEFLKDFCKSANCKQRNFPLSHTFTLVGLIIYFTITICLLLMEDPL